MPRFKLQVKTILARRRVPMVFLGLVLLLGLGVYLFLNTNVTRVTDILDGQECRNSHSDLNDRLACWHNIIAKSMETDGIPSAINTFATLYRWFPEFADAGCHFQAHQVGDLAYYSYFVAEGMALSEIDFPDSTASCGNGFFHGFLEHLIQSKPTAEAIYSECEDLIAKQEGVNPRIRIACYHASGHGLARAELDRRYNEPITDVQAFVARPLAECARIAETKFIERQNCSQGVLNVVVNWMSLEKYGLSISREKPFGICDELFHGTTYYDQCLVEISRKIDGLSDQDPKKIVQLLNPLSISNELRTELLMTAIAGVIQQIVRGGDPIVVLKKCEALSKDDFLVCQNGIVRGLILNGSPRSEIESVAAFCRSEMVARAGDELQCWQTAGNTLGQFYAEEKYKYLCRSLGHDECQYFQTEHVRN